MYIGLDVCRNSQIKLALLFGIKVKALSGRCLKRFVGLARDFCLTFISKPCLTQNGTSLNFLKHYITQKIKSVLNAERVAGSSWHNIGHRLN